MCVLSVGSVFGYVIPSFNVLQVEMRQARVKGYNAEGDERQYDIFIRNDSSLCRVFPAWMVVKDLTFVEVRCETFVFSCFLHFLHITFCA